MEAKASKLKEAGCKIEYFTKKDADIIRTWSKKDSDTVWKEIKENENLKGFATNTCPYCLLYSDCADCAYANYHGACGAGDYNKIITYLTKKEIKVFNVFDDAFYKDLIKELKKEIAK